MEVIMEVSLIFLLGIFCVFIFFIIKLIKEKRKISVGEILFIVICVCIIVLLGVFLIRGDFVERPIIISPT